MKQLCQMLVESTTGGQRSGFRRIFPDKLSFRTFAVYFCPATLLLCPQLPRFSSAPTAPWLLPLPAELRLGCARRIIISTSTIPLFRGITHAYCPVGRTALGSPAPESGGPGSLLPFASVSALPYFFPNYESVLAIPVNCSLLILPYLLTPICSVWPSRNRAA